MQSNVLNTLTYMYGSNFEVSSPIPEEGGVDDRNFYFLFIPIIFKVLK